ncbi:MAG: transcriptional repressor [Verrucomicrobiales bacterium]|jgi:Fur family ferric uptake transcriptional regulator|nr:transcriptional repressor [Verrucomicrobiales bacterium]
MQRETKQREAIRLVFERHEAPLLPAEVLRLARRRARSLSLATVYRTLNALAREKVLRLVALPGEAPRYELAGKRHHHHFVCRRCRKVFEVHACAGSIRRMVPKGFVMDGHEITLYGACWGCLTQNSRRKTTTANSKLAGAGWHFAK